MDAFPIRTDSEGRTQTKYVDDLSDADLSRLNDLLPWQCFTLDSNGRRFGKQASAKKRNLPQAIPDHRITELNRRFPLAGLSVLEVGCFEGVHTIALAGYGAKVVGIDSRIENVAKTMVRTWSFGFEATVQVRCRAGGRFCKSARCRHHSPHGGALPPSRSSDTPAEIGYAHPQGHHVGHPLRAR